MSVCVVLEDGRRELPKWLHPFISGLGACGGVWQGVLVGIPPRTLWKWYRCSQCGKPILSSCISICGALRQHTIVGFSIFPSLFPMWVKVFLGGVGGREGEEGNCFICKRITPFPKWKIKWKWKTSIFEFQKLKQNYIFSWHKTHYSVSNTCTTHSEQKIEIKKPNKATPIFFFQNSWFWIKPHFYDGFFFFCFGTKISITSKHQ